MSELGGRRFERPPLRRVFAIRDYRLLWSGALAMIIAQQLRFLAIPQWVLDETGEFAQVAIIGAIQLPVQIVAVLYGGVLADRLDRRWLMAGSNAVVFLLLVLLAAAASAGILRIWQTWVAIAILAALAVFVAPARATITPRVVPERYLSTAVTIDTAPKTAAGSWATCSSPRSSR